jgi:hypothetical protein
MTWYGAVRERSRLAGRGQAALGATVALAAGCLVLAGSGTAAAAPTPACPAGSAPGTVVCAYTGGAQYWTVPAGVTQATFTVYGANGGTSALDAAAGSGAEVTGTLAVSAGTVYQVNVGQAGGYDGNRGTGSAFGGGGEGGSDGAGGGGASDVRDGAYGLADRLLVAGGGGGGALGGFSDGENPIANGGAGGNADTKGQTGQGAVGSCGEVVTGGGGGGAGTTSAGGSLGLGSVLASGNSCGLDGGNNGTAGTLGAGGNGGFRFGAGGGGGGYYGGGGGGGQSIDEQGMAGGAGGGGGGASYTGTASDASINDSPSAWTGSPNGEVIINYGLAITTRTLPGGTVGGSYSGSLAAANGTTPYSWELASGSSLPPGLELSSSGDITGTPAAGGTFGFAVQATDSTTPTAMTATQQLSITISPATPGVSLGVSPTAGTATTLTPVTLTATISGVAGGLAPGGTVSFTQDGSPVSTCQNVAVGAVSGQASCSLGDLAATSYDFGANYSGDSDYTSGSASVTGYVVSLAPSSVLVTPAPSAPVVGQPVSFTATVTSGGSPVTGGTVQWLVDGSDDGSPVPVNGNGIASLGPVSGLGTGSHTVEADFSDAGVYAASSQQITLDVGQATPGVSLAVTPSAGSATVVTPVTLIADAVGVAGVATPSGSFSFTENGAPITACQNVTVTLGQASCLLGDLAADTYSFGASYSGDDNYVSGSASTTGYQVSLLPSQVVITPGVSAPVFGQPVGFTATVTSGGNPVTGGTVQWLVDGTDVGSPVSVGPAGTATLGPISDLGAGPHTVEADFVNLGTYQASSQQLNVVVGQAATTTAVAVTGTRLSATVTAVAPGAGTPTGTVTFDVNGKTVGTANLNPSGTASLAYATSGAETVSAAYGGDANFTGSSGSTATKNPVISAMVSSKYPKTKYGWYRSPVTITFTCAAGSAPLTGPCPGAVTLRRNGAAQSVTRTIHGTDGGIATVDVSPINIDQTKPVVKVTGAKNGATYEAPGPAGLKCTATDSLSGLAAPCDLTVKRTEAKVSWTATATSKAGVTTTVAGRFRLTDFYVARAPRVHGRYVVTVGKTYTVVAYLIGATKAPRYVDAAPAGVKPHPVGAAMTKIGARLWAIRASITTTMDRKYEYWTLGVLSGGHLHIILITLRR